MKKLIIIAGPCAIENYRTTDNVAQVLAELQKKLQFDLIFKASYRKANRTKGQSFHGMPMEESLPWLQDIGKLYGLKTITDVHETKDVDKVAEFVDILQIPAFLCRQTDLLRAAMCTGKQLNIKKGQFMSPESMQWVVKKVCPEDIPDYPKPFLTERGTTFGYNDLIVDMRGITIMQRITHCTVLVDITHSQQKPNLPIGSSGNWIYAENLGLAAIAAGADGLFMETHPNPEKAVSDKDTQIPLRFMEDMLFKFVQLYKFMQTINHPIL